MEGIVIENHNDVIDKFFPQKTLSDTLRILIPLYATYMVFALGVFFLLIPQYKSHMRDQKKDTIRQLTNSAVSLLTDYDDRVQKGELTRAKAQQQAIDRIRNLRYGPQGKDYFWINDLHPFMIMHPYRPDLEGQDLTEFKDSAGNYPFIAMVQTVMSHHEGYVNYYWQWKDSPEKIVPKISYVKQFDPWNWIIGTGIYLDDISQQINALTQKLIQIFAGLFLFIMLLSIYISYQVYRMDRKKRQAENHRRLDELRLKKLYELSQMTEQPVNTMTAFAIEEAIQLTQSQIGFLAFLNEDETRLTMHTWSWQAMKACEIKDKIMEYKVADTGLWSRSARTRKPEIINNYQRFESAEKKGCPTGHVEMTRIMNIPVFDKGRIVAVAGVGNKAVDYDSSDVRQLQLMMHEMWRIIQRKQNEDHLRRSEERYRLLADNAMDVIWVMEIDTLTVTYVSPAVENLLGYTPEDFLKLELQDYLGKESLQKSLQSITQELKRGNAPHAPADQYQALEIEMLKKNGETVWVEIVARLLKNNIGSPDRILGLSRDMSRRKNLEERLRQSNTDLLMAQRIAGIGNWTVDLETNARTWSEQIYRIFERDPDLGPISIKEAKQYFVAPWKEKYRSAMKNALENGKAFDIELRMTLPPAKIKWIHIICAPGPAQDRKKRILRGTIQDITQRKHLESQIQQSQKMEALGTLAGGIAHDFNNILSSILGFTELAKMDADHIPEAVNSLEQVITAGLRARDLVQHILTFSRKSDAEYRLVKVIPLVKECLKFLKASSPPNIDIQKNFSSNDFCVMADPGQFHQMIMNLLTNAVYAMKDGGGTLNVKLKSVTIRQDDIMQAKPISPGPYVQILISDTGCGIPKRLCEKIFEPFFTTKQRGEGTGMGLSTVYGIIKGLKGDISVYSEPGMGTCFKILIPEKTMDASPEHALTQAELITGKGKILLVDDEAPIVKWASQVLQKLGYEVDGVTDPLHALDIFQSSPETVDLIITDLAMPKMTGLEMAKKIKKVRAEIPVIVCTGFSDGLDLETIEECHISAMIMKPMIASELSKIIKNVLDVANKKNNDHVLSASKISSIKPCNGNGPL